MTTQHTPGPWITIEKWNPDTCLIGTPTGTTKHLATIHARPDGDMHFNASLIAAAPDLLAALDDVLALFDNQGDTRPYTWKERLPIINQARTAIAKAKGEEQP